jgi:Zn-finger nucleic acid-binding protein
MREVSARARTGYLIALDQCGACGGVWCDRWELFPLSASEAARLDPVDTRRLHSDGVEAMGPGRCPRCEIPLHPFTDPSLPHDSRIERCRVCEGMWLNRGELKRVKQRAGAVATLPNPDVEQLVRSYGREARWSKVEDISAAMAAGEESEDDDDPLSSLPWTAVAWVVLRALLYLLLRRGA